MVVEPIPTPSSVAAEAAVVAADAAAPATPSSIVDTETVAKSEDDDWTEAVRTEYATNCADSVFCCRPYPLNPGTKGHIYLNKNKSELGNGGRDITMVGAFNSWKVSATLFDVCLDGHYLIWGLILRS